MCSPPLAPAHLGGPGDGDKRGRPVGAGMLWGHGHRRPGRTNAPGGDVVGGMLWGGRDAVGQEGCCGPGGLPAVIKTGSRWRGVLEVGDKVGTQGENGQAHR